MLCARKAGQAFLRVAWREAKSFPQQRAGAWQVASSPQQGLAILRQQVEEASTARASQMQLRYTQTRSIEEAY